MKRVVGLSWLEQEAIPNDFSALVNESGGNGGQLSAGTLVIV
jgi:hypothetical protein